MARNYRGMAEVLPYGKRNHYPHLMPEDVAVWERFIEAFPDMYENCQYDVLVGTVPDFVTENEDEAMRKQGNLYQKKIDVVGLIADQIDIIELKPRCTMSTIGQVKGYKHLYMRDYTPPVEPKAIVICGDTTPDVAEFAAGENVQIVVV